MTLDIAIKSFANFLNYSWEAAIPFLLNRSYTSDESSIGDWMQANWELLVERKVLAVNKYLEIYGAGGDFNGASSRITDSEACPNFEILVRSNSYEILDYLNKERFILKNVVFSELVSFKDNFYKIEPNFEYALIDDNGLERVIKLSDIVFELKETRLGSVTKFENSELLKEKSS